ncbi:MAG: hypothetical protein M1840_005126 [Geoglossum simile]|nr:MAG: hypothetical protein M1840_005126 [Geoglossum simile]
MGSWATCNLGLPSLSVSQTFATALAAWLIWKVARGVYNVYFHPLSRFPGPAAAKVTQWWTTYVEIFKQQSMVKVLVELHKIHGDIVRISPNELHFSRPAVYHEIYSKNARWDKPKQLYHNFDADQSSFGYLGYREAKERKDMLNPLFSRRAIVSIQCLVQEKLDLLCAALQRQCEAGKSSDLFLGFRCFAVDTITALCFARSINAIEALDFRVPIVEDMEAAMATFVMFRHFSIVKWLTLNCPPWLSVRLNLYIAGLVELQFLLAEEVVSVIASPWVLEEVEHPTIFHQLLSRGVPWQSLFDEVGALLFGGTNTVGNSLMIGTFHIIENQEIYNNLKRELLSAWPVLELKPKYEELERLPYLVTLPFPHCSSHNPHNRAPNESSLTPP